MLQSFSVEKKIALLTGCSSGIGWHCAKQLALHPEWRVFATARRDHDVEALQRQGLEAYPLDLASTDSIAQAVETVQARGGGRIDALFNNGAYGQPGAVEDLPISALRQQFEVNVFGTQALTNAIIPLMRKQRSGRIIQNSSVLGFVSLPYRGAYCASKYALEALSDTMRLELVGSGIHVILIEPGPITSQFRANATRAFNHFFSADAVASSAHERYYRQHLQTGEGMSSRFSLGPEAVYQAFLHALNSPTPRRRYHVTAVTTIFWWARRLLPTAMVDALLRRAV